MFKRESKLQMGCAAALACFLLGGALPASALAAFPGSTDRGLISMPVPGSSTAPAHYRCEQCDLLASQVTGTPGAADQANLGLNIASMLSQRPGGMTSSGGSVIGLPHFNANAPLAPAGGGQFNWAPGQELPFAFQQPWDFAPTNFNPGFETTFYSDSRGPLNTPDAPWNLFLGAAKGAEYFNQGTMRLGAPTQLNHRPLVWRTESSG